MKLVYFLICLRIYIRRRVLFQRDMCIQAMVQGWGDLLGHRFIFQRGIFGHPKNFLESVAQSDSN